MVEPAAPGVNRGLGIDFSTPSRRDAEKSVSFVGTKPIGGVSGWVGTGDDGTEIGVSGWESGSGCASLEVLEVLEGFEGAEVHAVGTIDAALDAGEGIERGLESVA